MIKIIYTIIFLAMLYVLMASALMAMREPDAWRAVGILLISGLSVGSGAWACMRMEGVIDEHFDKNRGKGKS